MTVALALPLSLLLAAAAPDARCDRAGPDAAWCAEVAARPRLPLAARGEREALREVYSRPELRRARADPEAARRLLASLRERILELFGTVEAERYASLGRTAFIAAGLVAALAALAAARRRRSVRASLPARGAGVERAPLPAPDRSEARAREALEHGDLAGAVRHAFLAALAALEEAGRLPADRSLTNGEMSARLGATDRDLGAEFGALRRRFDRTIYGGRPVTAPEARDAIAAVLRIRGALEGAA